MELSKRLKMNVDLVPEGSLVADIGCDHGYCSVYLAKEKKCRVLAMDVGKGPLASARENIAQAGLDGQIECRLSDGLSAVSPGEVNTLLIAGMGGMLQIHILEKDPAVMKQVTHIILQPQSDHEAVRRYLIRCGFVIRRESFCVDAGKPYTALYASRHEEADEEIRPYSDAEYAYGRFLPEIKDPSYYHYLQNEMHKYKGLLLQLKKEDSVRCQERVAQMEHILELLKQTSAVWNVK